jgi:ABC-type branched-subunit amino acid transport system substrate-binding protein
MANYLFHQVKAKSVYVLDDGGAFGVGIADSFERRAKELGMKVVGRDRLDPKEADYKTSLTKIKGMNPDALYYGGVMQAAAKLATQAHEILPRVVKAGSDGVYDLSWPQQSGKEARWPGSRSTASRTSCSSSSRSGRCWRSPASSARSSASSSAPRPSGSAGITWRS